MKNFFLTYFCALLIINASLDEDYTDHYQYLSEACNRKTCSSRKDHILKCSIKYDKDCWSDFQYSTELKGHPLQYTVIPYLEYSPNELACAQRLNVSWSVNVKDFMLDQLRYQLYIISGNGLRECAVFGLQRGDVPKSAERVSFNFSCFKPLDGVVYLGIRRLTSGNSSDTLFPNDHTGINIRVDDGDEEIDSDRQLTLVENQQLRSSNEQSVQFNVTLNAEYYVYFDGFCRPLEPTSATNLPPVLWICIIIVVGIFALGLLIITLIRKFCSKPPERLVILPESRRTSSTLSENDTIVQFFRTIAASNEDQSISDDPLLSDQE